MELYFRGTTNSSYKLVPKLLRSADSYIPTADERENEIFCRTIVMASSEISKVSSSWNLLAMFQHYQIPRLLDWSSSLMTALMFALKPCFECAEVCKNGKCKKSVSPVIWVINPFEMHDSIHKGTEVQGLIAITVGADDNILQDYKKIFIQSSGRKSRKGEWKYKRGPIFLEIPWANPRIKAQKGSFTFHYDSKPIDDFRSCGKWLRKIEIPTRKAKKIRDELIAIGMNEFDIYPDLIHLAETFERTQRISLP